ncbi:MAG: hypothetical protein IPM46_06720 [Flavobacteriales bacterium]|nr:hypothetical protein [Flavobacteriales bacterium]
MLIRSLLFTLALIGFAQAGSAQTDMRFFVGTWDFRIWVPGNTTEQADLTGTWYLESGLDSALALAGRVVLNDGPNAVGGDFTRELIAFDVHTKSFTRTNVTNTGGYYFFTSTGWEGDRITWTGSQHSATGTIELREEIERTGPDSFDAVFYRKEGEAWVVQTREKLQRTAEH